MQQLQYRVLVAHLLSQQDQVEALARARTIVSGDEATKQYQGKTPWGCRMLDLQGRARVLTYKGAEAVLYFRREITTVEILPGDPVPVGVLQDPADAWVRLELLAPSTKQVSAHSTKQRIDLARAVQHLERDNQTLTQQNERLETKLAAALVDLKAATTELREIHRSMTDVR